MTRRLNPSSRLGFSFAEVMFAVVILGIGFIMIAAIFPVAMQQTQSTSEDNNAANVAREAANVISSLPGTIPNPLYKAYNTSLTPLSAAEMVQNQFLFPPTVKNNVPGSKVYTLPIPLGTPGSGTLGMTFAAIPPGVVVPFVGTRWDYVKANTIINSDARYAYSVFYKRDSGQSVAQLIVVALASRNQPVYNPNDLPPTSGVTINANRNPILVTKSPPSAPGSLPQTVIIPDTVTITSGTAREGNYVTLASGTPALSNPLPPARTYLLGRPLNSGGSLFEMMPGEGMSLTPGTGGAWGTYGATVDNLVSMAPATLTTSSMIQPTVAYAQLTSASDSPAGRITLYADPSSTTPAAGLVAGAFVIIADDFSYDPTNPTSTNYALPFNVALGSDRFTVGSMNGRIFRIAQQITEDNNAIINGTVNNATAFMTATYNLDVSYGMRLPSNGGTFSPDLFPNKLYVDSSTNQAAALNMRAKVYIIGGGSTGTGTVRTGAAQDIGAYSTFFQVK